MQSSSRQYQSGSPTARAITSDISTEKLTGFVCGAVIRSGREIQQCCTGTVPISRLSISGQSLRQEIVRVATVLAAKTGRRVTAVPARLKQTRLLAKGTRGYAMKESAGHAGNPSVKTGQSIAAAVARRRTMRLVVGGVIVCLTKVVAIVTAT